MSDEGTLVADARRWLHDHPDAPLKDRAAMAVVIASGGDRQQEVSMSEIAQALGDYEISSPTLLAALEALKDEQEIEPALIPAGLIICEHKCGKRWWGETSPPPVCFECMKDAPPESWTMRRVGLLPPEGEK